MRIERRGAIVALAMLCATHTRVSAQDIEPHDSPAAAVNAFYSAYLSVEPNGLPSEAHLRSLVPLMSKRLVTLVRAALAYQARFIREHSAKPSPDGGPPLVYKPPFVDGDYLSMSFDEPPTDFRVGAVTPRGATYRVGVHFTHRYRHPSADGSSRLDWTSVAIVVREGGRLVLDDVEFLDNWPYAKHALLSEVLSAR